MHGNISYQITLKKFMLKINSNELWNSGFLHDEQTVGRSAVTYDYNNRSHLKIYLFININ